MPDSEPRRPALNAPTPVHGHIGIVAYDRQWPVRFAVERDRILDALGNRALEIHHVGSTAVPGLAAKPVVDIAIAVADASRDEEYVPALEAAGFALRRREPVDDRDPGEPHRLLKSPGLDVNLHVYSTGATAIDHLIAFRDWLIAHSDDAQRYQQAKLQLASLPWTYAHEYAEAKTGVIMGILAKAGA